MINSKEVNFEKSGGLVPAVIQDAASRKVLMLGYMNEAALEKTLTEKRVCFYSRSKQRLWTKGEESGNFLELVDLELDCDQDTLLLQVNPAGPCCHTGQTTCFGDESAKGFVYRLENIIQERRQTKAEDSYVSRMYQKGTAKLAQKVGEEAVELVIEAMDDQLENFKAEAADLLFHYLMLLQDKELKLSDIERVLAGRNK